VGYGREGPKGPVEIRVLEPGESGIITSRLTQPIVEALASYWAQPNHLRIAQRGKASDIAFLASRLRITPGFVRKSQRDPRVLAAIRKRVNEAVHFYMPDVVYAQLEKAINDRDTTAATWLGKMQGWIKDSGINVTTNVGVNVQSSKDGGLAEDLANYTWLRDLQRTGVFERLKAQRQLGDGTADTEP
jgi:hypothetical protein